ncbi:hypothetical protein BD311DRAFT_763063, partial [Dichomitus squalens]
MTRRWPPCLATRLGSRNPGCGRCIPRGSRMPYQAYGASMPMLCACHGFAFCMVRIHTYTPHARCRCLTAIGYPVSVFGRSSHLLTSYVDLMDRGSGTVHT